MYCVVQYVLVNSYQEVLCWGSNGDGTIVLSILEVADGEISGGVSCCKKVSINSQCILREKVHTEHASSVVSCASHL